MNFRSHASKKIFKKRKTQVFETTKIKTFKHTKVCSHYTLIRGLVYICLIKQELDTYEVALTVFLYMAGLSSICKMRAILEQFTSKILTEMSFRLMTFVSLGPN